MKITPPDYQNIQLWILGETPYIAGRFSLEKQKEIMDKQAGISTNDDGSTVEVSKSKKPKRKPRDFEKEFLGSMYTSEDGWYGMPAAAFRNAMVRACSVADMMMTHAKLSIFVHADGFCKDTKIPLVRVYHSKADPIRSDMPVKISMGATDIRTRAMFKNWAARVRVRFFKPQFNETDVTNLMARVGMQVGVGEGRPFVESGGMGLGFGLFQISNERNVLEKIQIEKR